MVSPFAKQAWTILGVLLSMFSQGILMGYTSILLPSLLDPESDIKVDLHTASWIASAIGMMGIPGFLLSAILMEMYGRRLPHGLAALPGVVGWLCIYYAKRVPLLVIGRALGGLSISISVSTGAIVIGEYAAPKHRGMFLNLKTVAVCFGNMASHILGYYYHWRIIALIGLIPLVASFLITCTWPESPAWLASRRRFKESEISFYWLRGQTKESTSEIEDLFRAQKERMSNALTKTSTCFRRMVEFLKKFTRRDFIKPVLIIMFGCILVESCGRHIFPAFALQIIEEVTSLRGQSFYYSLGMDITITTSALLSSILINYMKRRTLLFGSGITALLILYSICGYLYLVNIEVFPSSPTVPILMFVIYFIVCNLGCTAIPLALFGEIFPLAHRGSGGFIAGSLVSIILTITMQVTPYLLVNAKVYGTFAILGTVMLLSLIALWILLPETKDKTLQEIENYLNYGKYSRDDNEARLKMIPA
ncbi:facilitated trehalose transporter Tret1-like [Aricia agestis]|uniref:facilitated trehalose transporter Tret1-like n=1 Tax=Aricia agestis TaxID=91739 RepID=UPI001C20AB5F|nr:facilitated trehalose transporter Tret1-like [Aricia agestis]